MSRTLDPRSLYPPQTQFNPVKKIHYSEFDLKNGVRYSDAVAMVEALTRNSSGNLTVAIQKSSAGTLAVAFSESPKVSQVLVYTDPRDYTRLENVLKALKKTSLVGIRPITSFESQIAEAKTNWLIFFNRGFPDQINVGDSNQIAGLYRRVPAQLPSGWEFSSVRVGDRNLVMGFPAKLNRTQLDNSDQNLWFRGLQQYLYQTLSRAASNPDHLNEMVSQGPMSNVWFRVFTSATVNPQINYESLEFIGDGTSGVAFTNYLRNNYPNLTASQFSSLKSYYMSEQYQPKLAEMIGLDKWIRFAVPPGTKPRDLELKRIKMLEDLFEAFFGGLWNVSADLYGVGTAMEYTMNMMNFIMDQVELDFDRAGGAARTVFEQLFQRLKWRKPIFDVLRVGTEVRVRILLDSSTRSRLMERGFPDPGEVLVEVTGKGEKNMINQAAEAGLEKMDQYGLRKETSEQIRQEQEFETSDLLRLKKELDQEYEAYGYENPRFESSTTSTGVMTNLMADLDGIPIVVAIGSGDSLAEAKLTAVETFLDQ